MQYYYHISFTKNGAVVYECISHEDEGRANFRAGEILNALADYHGGKRWNYTVRALPFAGSNVADHVLVRHALEKAIV